MPIRAPMLSVFGITTAAPSDASRSYLMPSSYRHAAPPYGLRHPTAPFSEQPVAEVAPNLTRFRPAPPVRYIPFRLVARFMAYTPLTPGEMMYDASVPAPLLS